MKQKIKPPLNELPLLGRARARLILGTVRCHVCVALLDIPSRLWLLRNTISPCQRPTRTFYRLCRRIVIQRSIFFSPKSYIHISRCSVSFGTYGITADGMNFQLAATRLRSWKLRTWKESHVNFLLILGVLFTRLFT